MVDMKTIAHQIQRNGWAPVALYSVSPDGQFCHCPKGGRCPSKGKHPINKEWASQPFPSAADVEAMWDKHPKAQVGIRTGGVSKVAVLDIDEGGKEALAPLVNANGGMPETLVVQTGSGGYHYYFSIPDGVEVRNSQSRVAVHVDIRGEGGQAVAPGARTDKGTYRVIHNAPVAVMPPWLIEANAGPREQVEFIPAAVTKRPQTAEEASYEGNMLSKQLGDRLGLLQNKPWAPGDAWDINCFEVACHVVELANSEWAAITHEEAYQRFMAAAPHDDQWDERQAKWDQAVSVCGSKAKEGPKGSGSVVGAAAVRDFPRAVTAAAPDHTLGSPALTDSDATMVDEFAEQHLTGRAWYVRQSRDWRTYEGGIWGDSSVKVIREMFRRYVLDQLALAASAGDSERIKLLTKYTAAGKIKAVAELSEGRMVIDAEAFDQRLDLMVVGNGVVDLRTGEMGPHDPAHLFTGRTPVPYIPDATHPDVTEMLRALPEDCQDWMQIRLGQAITGYPTWDDVMPILQGGGANGKSSLIVGLQKALGDYLVMVSERVLLAGNSDHTTDLTDLRGARLAVIEELPQDAPLNIKRLKDTLGTAKIRARRMRENNAEWLATHSLFLTTNYIPRVIETDHGTWRRLALVKFPWRYVAAGQPLTQPEDRRGDDQLRYRLEAGEGGQHEAILAWLITGARKWYATNRARLPSPPSVADNTSTWRTEADKIWGFLQERMEFDPASQVLSTELFSEFSAYLASIGASNWTDQTFAVRLREHHLAHENQIAKVRTVRLEGLSRPGDAYQEFAPGQQATVWRGLKFAERAPKKGVVSLADWR